MFEAIKKLFKRERLDYGQMVKNGAVIIDVRTPQEYRGGHIKGSKNVPLNEIPHKLKQFKNKENTYITCCASGMRSSSAKSIMKKNGYLNVYNGGGWALLKSKL